MEKVSAAKVRQARMITSNFQVAWRPTHSEPHLTKCDVRLRIPRKRENPLQMALLFHSESCEYAGFRYYSATNVESRLCRNSPVHVVGAGNSAGQAAMFLSQSADEVSLLVRGTDLPRMSTYLSERLRANPTVRIRFGSEVVGIEGVESIAAVHVRGPNGDVHNEASAGLFVFIGSQPRTGFLP